MAGVVAPSILLAYQWEPDYDTLTGKDTLRPGLLLNPGTQNTPRLIHDDPIVAMLDSLANIKLYSNKTFRVDTVALNKYHFDPGVVPLWSDSTYSNRLNDLQRKCVIDLTYNQHVKTFIQLYTEKKRQVSARILGLSKVYFPLFEQMLDRYNLPLELKYLAVVESALNPLAVSRAGAKGLWQFMYNTGKIYGLGATSLMDDRFDPYKSTDAACRHLKDLYDIYHDWHLVLAAYNCGAGNVNRAIRRSGGLMNFWAIWPYLPMETRAYVPSFIAVTYVMNYPSEHNLYPRDPGIIYDGTDTVMVNDVLSFDQLSEMLHVPGDVLTLLNPAYRAGIIPAGKGVKHPLTLPKEYVDDFINNEKALYAYKTQKGIEKEKLLAEVEKAKVTSRIHIVKKGQTLGSIAQKYRCSVQSLKKWNKLKGTTIHPGQKLVVQAPDYQPRKTTQENPVAKASVNDSSDKATGNDMYHTVRKGETLASIARAYNCSVEDLRKWNSLANDTIRPEQKLAVSAGLAEIKQEEPTPQQPVVRNQSVSTTQTKYIYHTVRKGDTLWDIANLYKGVTVDQIKKLNNIKDSRSLQPGQKLKVAVENL
jgi:membrane-bound lytic murein transglycosylase D